LSITASKKAARRVMCITGRDEWFYVIVGEFAFEIGDRKLRLGPGETLFVPRNVPHGWAHVGGEPGTLLTTVSPAGTFETFISTPRFTRLSLLPKKSREHSPLTE
jgi:mannose-6-phosphate isomerase-like protein (cupin superfamily)